MALTIQKIGSEYLAYAFDSTNGEMGIIMKIVNGTGNASVKGSVVSNSPSADNKFVLQANEYDAIGVVAESGIAADAGTWVWKNGSRAKVLWKNGQTATRAYVALCADTDGRAINIDVPSSNPVVGEHFKEIGHVCESANSATDLLVLVDLHFN